MADKTTVIYLLAAFGRLLNAKRTPMRRYLSVWLFAVAALLVRPGFSQPYTIQASPDQGCKPLNTTLTISGIQPSNVSYVEWDFGDGQTQTTNGLSTGYIYSNNGTFMAKATVYLTNGQSVQTDSVQVTVFDLPNAAFTLLDDDTQCFVGNQFCFQDQSTPGADGSPIIDWFWAFGTGATSTLKDPCYSYNASGDFIVQLQVKDGNGCVSQVTTSSEKKIHVLPDLGAYFTVQYAIGCDDSPTVVTFKNLTDSNGKQIIWWAWDFDDGTIDSTPTAQWTGFTHSYTVGGTFHPRLILRTAFGCTDTFRLPGGILNIEADFNITAQYDSCFEGNQVFFSQPAIPGTLVQTWTFDDPMSGNQNIATGTWSPSHVYRGGPGYYHVTLNVKFNPVYGCPDADTVACFLVRLLGPVAAIQVPSPPNPPNNFIPHGGLLTVDTFYKTLYNECLFKEAQIDSDKVVIGYSYGDSIPFDIQFRWCNADTVPNTPLWDTAKTCPDTADTRVWIVPAQQLIPTDTDTLQYAYVGQTWFRPFYSTWAGLSGTALIDSVFPPGLLTRASNNQVWEPGSGTVNILRIHDTDLYQCDTPNWVHFTNVSTKWRGYYYSSAVDDYAGAIPDTCDDNPSYPYASDSLLFFWNFGTGENCTSTEANPVDTCMFSTERTPVHYYGDSPSCYNATLIVFDSVTGCESQTQILLPMAPPDAGWDTTYYDYLNRNMQRGLPRYPAVPRRGFLFGTAGGVFGGEKACVSSAARQYWLSVDISELAPTNCTFQDWDVVFDSAADCQPDTCMNILYTYINDTVVVPYDTIYKPFPNCQWVDKSVIQMLGMRWLYGTAGCKTIGVRLQIAECYDTFWYHNYLYVHDNDPRFIVYNNYDTTEMIPEPAGAGPAIRTCAPFTFGLRPRIPDQAGIHAFAYNILAMARSPLSYPSMFDTGSAVLQHGKLQTQPYYTLCLEDSFIMQGNQKIYTHCFSHPSIGCGAPTDSIPLDTFLNNGYIATDTTFYKDLRDTIFTDSPYFNYPQLDTPGIGPGVYAIASSIINAEGCNNAGNQFVIVGHYAYFEADDTVKCMGTGDTVTFTASLGYFVIPPDPAVGPWVIFDTAWSENRGIVQWDVNGDGIYDTAFDGLTTVRTVYTQPGVYTVRMRTVDTFGCEQITTRTFYIQAVQVEADFDTLAAPNPCAPQAVSFVDQSRLWGNYQPILGPGGQIVDSAKTDSIVSWEWDFGDNKGPGSRGTIQNPTHLYTTNGVFDVRLIVKTANGCVDTLVRPQLVVIDGPKPAFTPLDTIGCVPFTVQVKDSSAAATNSVAQSLTWQWVLGDGTSNVYRSRPADSVFHLTYAQPGRYELRLVVSDSSYIAQLNDTINCAATYPDTTNPLAPRYYITVLPKNVADFEANKLKVCVGEEIVFTEKADSIYSEWYWFFGDGTQAAGSQVVHAYTDSVIHATYTVTMIPDSAPCPDTATMTIEVLGVQAAVDTLPSSSPPVYQFANKTRGGDRYTWIIRRKSNGQVLRTVDMDTEDSLEHDFGNEQDTFEVCIIARNEISCDDTDCITIFNIFDPYILPPNLMTPNGDDQNDHFEMAFNEVTDFTLVIYNRWGEKMYKATEKDEDEKYQCQWVPKSQLTSEFKNVGTLTDVDKVRICLFWDGNRPDGRPAKEGTYYYVVRYQFRGETKKQTLKGSVTLQR